MRFLAGAFLLLFCVSPAASEKNSTALMPGLFLVGPVVDAQFPPNIKHMDTAIAVRYAFMGAVLFWDMFTVCDPTQTALNFFGGADRLPQHVCMMPGTPGELYAYSFIRVTELEFPEPAQNYARIMIDNGYDPEDRSMDTSTAVGMGNVIGSRLAEWMGEDGWNSRGDLTRLNFRRPFEDYTDYAPVNGAQHLTYPLRWQPLVDTDAKLGRYTEQEHVTPFLGYVKPLLMSHAEYVDRYVEQPYSYMNATSLSASAAETMDSLVREAVEASANSTPEERALALWFDNKFNSLGTFGAGYMTKLGFDKGAIARWYLGEAFAQHDAMLLAWKEKRRIDAVRPRSIVHNYYADEYFQSFVSPEIGVTTVKGKDWEPLIPTQPHSEHPSASAALCTAFAEHATHMLNEYVETNGLGKVPDITLQTYGIVQDFKEFTFESITEAGQICGKSRVWAGVHFPPAVAAGQLLVEGIGHKGFEFARDFSEGRVPAGCWWCTG